MRKVYCLLFLVLSTFSLSAKVKGVKHVVLIGLDGWGAYSVPAAEMPTIKKMMEEGAWTLENRSVLPSSSACNWASMIMGASPELHGYTTWGSQKPDLPPRELNQYGMFPTLFSLLKDQQKVTEMGCIYEWDGIGYLFEKEVVNFDKHVSDAKKRPESTMEEAVKYIREKRPDFTWIVFDEPDGVGHKEGHDTPAYYQKLTELDTYVAKIIQATRDAGMFDNTLFVVVADHGGIDKNHGGKTMQEMQIPFILWGKGVKKGHHIQGSMMIYDIGSTIAWVFGARQPQVWIGRPLIEAFK